MFKLFVIFVFILLALFVIDLVSDAYDKKMKVFDDHVSKGNIDPQEIT